jgi:hypothetical protein
VALGFGRTVFIRDADQMDIKAGDVLGFLCNLLESKGGVF